LDLILLRAVKSKLLKTRVTALLTKTTKITKGLYFILSRIAMESKHMVIMDIMVTAPLLAVFENSPTSYTTNVPCAISHHASTRTNEAGPFASCAPKRR
jgi:hypothetical protein